MQRKDEQAASSTSAFTEAWVRYALGDGSFSTAWDQFQMLGMQLTDELREAEAIGRELDGSAVEASARCMSTRAALGRECSHEFNAIVVP
jgi:hypothetical protein